MRGWLIRGLNMAVLWGIVQTVHARLDAGGSNSQASVVVELCLLAAVAMVWGALDTWAAREDRGMRWLKSALLAGVLGSLLGVIGQAAFVDQTGSWAIGPALIGAAPFIALGVLVPAGVGMGIGHLVRAPQPAEPKPDKSIPRG